ncbi:hypothetical protein [Vreelandella populi]|uniref:hypothetical protein n=1 Tax=Vreelandella populi TaxID=2498858 RepID=UPI000F8CDDC3|nr:hypothetical protein [Halomonas populi]RUR38519.1 hypothetical protein ELY25_09145 [Halomonas populi]
MQAKYEHWEEYELTFLRETYTSKKWSVQAIAEKLERTISCVSQKAYYLGLKRPNRKFSHRNNPEFVADLNRLSIAQNMHKWNCTRSEVERGRAQLKAQREVEA